ncbi:MAG TPA: hypothetical protein DDY78_10990 [Planctomycetales bacterium]|jgi:hypothetical protein|nr:hypothetical protein [Planctomycetales bacterium]
MKFVDYAPPASPSLEQQRDALQKGLGRAMQWALVGQLNDEPLLEACLQDQRHDSQLEACRGDWLWEIVRTVGATDRFRVPILHALYELSDDGSADQLCGLARCYGATGDEPFRTRLYEIVEQKPFPCQCPSLGEEEIIALDGEQAFLFAAKMRGRSLAKPEEWDDGSLGHFAVERFGEERVSALLDGSSDAEITRFRECWRRIELHWTEQRRNGSQEGRMAATSVTKIIQEAEGESMCYWFMGWGKNASEADLLIVLQRLWTEQDPKVIVKLLRVFSGRALPEFDARFFDLCRHGDEEIRRRAFHALERNTLPLIREFALNELQRGMPDESVVGLFINNYGQGDEQRILEAMVLPDDVCLLHWLFYDVVEILEKNPKADCSQLGLVCYVVTPCGNCRFRSARLLLKQQAAPQWLMEECRHDSGKECRELFANAAGSTE